VNHDAEHQRNPIVGSYTQSTGALSGADAGNYTLAALYLGGQLTRSAPRAGRYGDWGRDAVYASALVPARVASPMW